MRKERGHLGTARLIRSGDMRVMAASGGGYPTKGAGMSGLAFHDDFAPLPTTRACPLDPPTAFADLRRERPMVQVLLPSGQLTWLLTRHEDVRRLLADVRLSADASRPGFPVMYREPMPSPLDGTLMRSDGEKHRRLRDLLGRELTIPRAEALRPLVREIVEGCLDDLVAQGPPADFHAHVALPVPSIVLAHVVGVPQEDRRFFESVSRTLFDTSVSRDELGQAIQEALGYLDDLVSRKEAEPADDSTSRLVAAMHDGLVNRLDLTMTLALLVVAGHESMSAQIGLSVLALLENPSETEMLRDDPRRIGPAVEELLRHQTVVQTPIPRVALEDVAVGAQTIRAGDGVLLPLMTANRDPDVFDDPDRLDIGRNDRSHLAFGCGPHECLGHALAKVELEEVLDAVVRRLPDLRLACTLDDVRFRPTTAAMFGVEEMPVAW